jgi:hypothetical protein
MAFYGHCRDVFSVMTELIIYAIACFFTWFIPWFIFERPKTFKAQGPQRLIQANTANRDDSGVVAGGGQNYASRRTLLQDRGQGIYIYPRLLREGLHVPIEETKSSGGMTEFQVGIGVPQTTEARIHALSAMFHCGLTQVPTALAVEICKDLCRARASLVSIRENFMRGARVYDHGNDIRQIELMMNGNDAAERVINALNVIGHNINGCNCPIPEFEKQ